LDAACAAYVPDLSRAAAAASASAGPDARAALTPLAAEAAAFAAALLASSPSTSRTDAWSGGGPILAAAQCLIPPPNPAASTVSGGDASASSSSSSSSSCSYAATSLRARSTAASDSDVLATCHTCAMRVVCIPCARTCHAQHYTTRVRLPPLPPHSPAPSSSSASSSYCECGAGASCQLVLAPLLAPADAAGEAASAHTRFLRRMTVACLQFYLLVGGPPAPAAGGTAPPPPVDASITALLASCANEWGFLPLSHLLLFMRQRAEARNPPAPPSSSSSSSSSSPATLAPPELRTIMRELLVSPFFRLAKVGGSTRMVCMPRHPRAAEVAALVAGLLPPPPATGPSGAGAGAAGWWGAGEALLGPHPLDRVLDPWALELLRAVRPALGSRAPGALDRAGIALPRSWPFPPPRFIVRGDGAAVLGAGEELERCRALFAAQGGKGAEGSGNGAGGPADGQGGALKRPRVDAGVVGVGVGVGEGAAAASSQPPPMSSTARAPTATPPYTTLSTVDEVRAFVARVLGEAVAVVSVSDPPPVSPAPSAVALRTFASPAATAADDVVGELSLLAIATRNETVVIDVGPARAAAASPSSSPSLLLLPLLPLLLDPLVVKVLHGGALDLMRLQLTAGLFLVNVFDTLVALDELVLDAGARACDAADSSAAASAAGVGRGEGPTTTSAAAARPHLTPPLDTPPPHKDDTPKHMRVSHVVAPLWLQSTPWAESAARVLNRARTGLLAAPPLLPASSTSTSVAAAAAAEVGAMLPAADMLWAALLRVSVEGAGSPLPPTSPPPPDPLSVEAWVREAVPAAPPHVTGDSAALLLYARYDLVRAAARDAGRGRTPRGCPLVRALIRSHLSALRTPPFDLFNAGGRDTTGPLTSPPAYAACRICRRLGHFHAACPTSVFA
jgi:hypothetical protein